MQKKTKPLNIPTPKKCASKRKSVRSKWYEEEFYGDNMDPEDEEYMWRCIMKDD